MVKVLGEVIEALNETLYEYSEHHCLNGWYLGKLVSKSWMERMFQVVTAA